MTTTMHGAMPGRVTSNEKAPGACGSKGLTTNTTNQLDFPTGERPRKALSILKEQFALKGFQLEGNHHADKLEITYWVSRWGQARAFTNLGDVQVFLVQIGGAHD